jgi:hypothetical protein
MWSEIFNDFDQGWNEYVKLDLLLYFLDCHDNTVVTPQMFRNYLQEVVDQGPVIRWEV